MKTWSYGNVLQINPIKYDLNEAKVIVIKKKLSI